MPSIYNSQISLEMAVNYPDMQNVLAKKSLSRSAKVYWIAEQLPSVAGFPFTVFGKHKKFNAGKEKYNYCLFFLSAKISNFFVVRIIKMILLFYRLVCRSGGTKYLLFIFYRNLA